MPPSHSEAGLQREHADAARTSRNENFKVLSSQKLNIKGTKTRMVTTAHESQCLSLFKMYARLSVSSEITPIQGSALLINSADQRSCRQIYHMTKKLLVNQSNVLMIMTRLNGYMRFLVLKPHFP